MSADEMVNQEISELLAVVEKLQQPTTIDDCLETIERITDNILTMAERIR